MKCISTTLFVSVLFLLSCNLFGAEKTLPEANILLLNSYHRGFSWTDDITQGVEDALGTKVKGLHVEYMDTKRYFDSTYEAILSDLLIYKHKRQHYDLIITSDDNALNFVSANRDRIFGDIPVVFCGANYFEKSRFKGFENYTGISEVVDVEANLTLIKHLHSTCEKILVITDNSNTGKRIQQEVLMQKDRAENNSIEIELVYDISIKELKKKLQSVESNTIVYYTIFFIDKQGVYLDYGESTTLVCSNSNVPVYGTCKHNLDYGIVGGYFINGYEQGTIVANEALEILSGKIADSIPVLERTNSHLMFDYEQLMAHNISVEKLPNNSIIINEPLNFYQKNRTVIHVLIVLIIILSVFVFSLGVVLTRVTRAKSDAIDSKNKFESIFLNSPLGILHYDKNGVILDVNDSIANILGASREELVGLGMRNLVDKNVIKAVNDSLTIGSGKYNDYYTTVLTNKVIPLRVLFKGLQNGSNKLLGGVGIAEDITQQKNFENEILKANKELTGVNKELIETSTALQKANQELSDALIVAKKSKELEKANNLLIQQKEEMHTTLNHLKKTQTQLIETEKLASIGILTSGIAHEINNPLNFIQGGKTSLQLYLYDNMNSHAEEIQPYFEMIDEGILRASNIIKGLNHFNRNTESYTEPCDLNLIINNCLAILENKFKHRVVVSKDFATSEMGFLGNSGRLHQVFLNILSNAEHAIEAKGEITIKTLVDKENMLAIITDTGCGIAYKDLNKVTDAFYTTKDPGAGTGLGMSITKSIITNHKGSLHLQSEQGKGTQITVSLPVNL